MAPTAPDARTAAAHHEAAHACLAARLGRPVTRASIRPSGTGLVEYVGEARPAFDGGEVFDHPAEDRAAVERAIVILEAGPLGELLVDRGARFPDQSDTAAAQALAQRLPPRHTELMTTAAGDVATDDAAADALAAELAGAEAMFVRGWLHAVAWRLVQENRDAIGRVAAALLVHGELDGAAILEAMESTT